MLGAGRWGTASECIAYFGHLGADGCILGTGWWGTGANCIASPGFFGSDAGSAGSAFGRKRGFLPSLPYSAPPGNDGSIPHLQCSSLFKPT